LSEQNETLSAGSGIECGVCYKENETDDKGYIPKLYTPTHGPLNPVCPQLDLCLDQYDQTIAGAMQRSKRVRGQPDVLNMTRPEREALKTYSIGIRTLPLIGLATLAGTVQ
jgi:hypothetical protein